MTVRLLGTGGADGIPALFRDDAVSRWARVHGGPDVRTRAAAIVDEGLKIDLPPETAAQLLRNGLRGGDWDFLFFTHSDDDHLALAELQYALYPFTESYELSFSIFGSETVTGEIRGRYPDWPMDLVEIRSFQPVEIAGYRVTPLRARHTPGEECFNFLIERGGRRLVYATDTGVWPDETIEFFAGAAMHLFIVECTNAFCPSSYLGHMDLEGLGYLLSRLRANGGINSDTRVVTTHHAATGGARHCDLRAALAPLGAEPGFDGMLLEV